MFRLSLFSRKKRPEPVLVRVIVGGRCVFFDTTARIQERAEQGVRSFTVRDGAEPVTVEFRRFRDWVEIAS